MAAAAIPVGDHNQIVFFTNEKKKKTRIISTTCKHNLSVGEVVQSIHVPNNCHGHFWSVDEILESGPSKGKYSPENPHQHYLLKVTYLGAIAPKTQ